MLFSFAGLSPFILMLVFGFPYMDIPTITTRKRESSIKWGTFITILLWNSAGYDCLGAFAGEVSNPGKTFPTAMITTMVLTNLIDFLAVMVGMGCVQDYESWSDGTFEKVASFIGGRTFGAGHDACPATSLVRSIPPQSRHARAE
eukprot:scaffold3759_cov425-Prasinococcus_capsulatus_cf.AAC.4